MTYLNDKGIISSLDAHFARFMVGLGEHDDPYLLLAAALLSSATGNGDVCLDLNSLAGKSFGFESDTMPVMSWPNVSQWVMRLSRHRVVGRPGEFCPLILDEKNRLYLYRYWAYEKKLSTTITDRAINECRVDEATLLGSLKRLFPDDDDPGAVWQQVAAITAAYKRFCVISGGPGTGKTFTVAKILALLLEQGHENRLRILLTAPTGKAADRLAESVKSAKAELNCPQSIIDAIPSAAATIHRILIPIPASPYFIHHADNPLEADVVVVDEASMIDLALMSKLLSAIPAQARLIVIGDKDQLASVEAGAVLGDICNRSDSSRYSQPFLRQLSKLTAKKIPAAAGSKQKDQTPVEDCITILQKNYRFDGGSEIAELSRAVNSGSSERTLSILGNSGGQLAWEKNVLTPARLRRLEKKIVSGYASYLRAANPLAALSLFNRFRILCVVRKGPYGVNAMNQLTEKLLRREGLITSARLSANAWYAGRPVLITRNDYHLELFNGDVGIALPLAAKGRSSMSVFFSGKSGQLRQFSPQRLPDHETAYAVTVHKSQGSEFDRVLMILPEHDAPIMTRELFYTGITRAVNHVSIWGSEDAVKAAVTRKIERASGLRDALWP